MTLAQIEALVKSGESETREFKRTTGERREAARALCAMKPALTALLLAPLAALHAADAPAKPNILLNQPVISLDVAATAVAAAGLPHDERLDGVNLVPFLTGANKHAPHDALSWRWGSQSALLEMPYKLIKLGNRPPLLFDITRPDGENFERNLAAKHPEIVARLEQRLRTWAASLQPSGLATEETAFSRRHEELFTEHHILAPPPAAPSPPGTKHAPEGGIQGWIARNGTLEVGVGIVDITPTEPVVLAGSPTPKKSSSVSSRLYVRASVFSAGGQKVAMVTLDTLKYPVEHVVRARQQIEKAVGIPASNVLICASHTHYGPLWSYYEDQLVTPIAKAVALAARDLRPCRLGTAQGKVTGVSECRRVIKDGRAWNRWQLEPSERDADPAESQADFEFDVLAVIGKDGRYKAVVYNFACHAANTRDSVISADYPGEVQQFVQKHLGYEVPTLFLTGACGDVNPIYSVKREFLGEKLGGEIIRCLGQLEPVAKPTLAIESREMQMPGREHPELNEAEIARNWPTQLEHYRKTFNDMQQRAKPGYPYFLTGIRIGDDFAIVTNPNELFCEIGMSIKRQSPFKHTMVAEQTNGAHGYVPTAKAFAGGSYETWFGEHSYLTTRAGEIIEKESLDILNRLKRSR